jgi:hypothetical protein|tara:strand:- start:250 stop:477 length:228 start_codon:yes stop_codon:yes gene_type:complete
MSTYYILQKNSFQGETMELKLPTEMIDQSGWFNLGPEPFTYDTYEEAKKIKEALETVFDKLPSSLTFIIVEETND